MSSPFSEPNKSRAKEMRSNVSLIPDQRPSSYSGEGKLKDHRKIVSLMWPLQKVLKKAGIIQLHCLKCILFHLTGAELCATFETQHRDFLLTVKRHAFYDLLRHGGEAFYLIHGQ